MKKITLIVLAIIWIALLVILIMALTDFFQDNVFQNHKLVVGFGFIATTGFIRMAIKKRMNPSTI